ncbi:MAG: putative membrane protein insertion efficiency factor [Candidatus Azotimanducaceae bacterium]|jgi:putative membrane protein insertion efficiency factor
MMPLMFKQMFSRALIIIVRLYQLTLSAVLGNRCRFYPSCSQYTVEAIQRFGPVKGVGLGSRRILRCQPFCEGGFDPVPDTSLSDHKA